ncbi:hypothetical protein KO02_10205 [Sphingobacterium sp. ML3W]|uniref:TolC family protein n=1 Tax=Sphingobacterium sp. ML3W TaxID=1538644 RepID=UPI0004F876FF|nr:TolC family protein [Sphingobacterium sp. ML3W]AIM37024.1 hypothetical protein KO02_10205 [Sphingobacterium sp. ML3W]
MSNLFELAMERNRDIKLSTAYLSRATSVVQDKKNNRLPVVGLSASAGYLTDVGVLGLGTMPTGYYDMPHFSNSFSLQASLLLYSGGRLSTDIDIAQLERNMATLQIEKNKQSVKLILAGYYLDLYQLYQQKKVYENNIAISKELLEKIDTRYQSGVALKSDKIRNELLVSTFELALSRLWERIQIVNNNMLATLSLPDNTVIVPDTDIEIPDKIVQLLSSSKLEHLQGNSLKNNIEARESEIKNVIADEKLKLARSSNRPEVSLFLSGAVTRPYTFDIPAKDIYANTNAIGVKVNIPISNLYLSKKKIEIATTDIEISHISKKQTEETVRRDLKNNYIKCREAYRQLSTLYKQQELADENYRRITDNYMEQLALNTEVMDASNQKLDASLRVTQAKVEIIFSYYKLLKTLGEL